MPTRERTSPTPRRRGALRLRGPAAAALTLVVLGGTAAPAWSAQTGSSATRDGGAPAGTTVVGTLMRADATWDHLPPELSDALGEHAHGSQDGHPAGPTDAAGATDPARREPADELAWIEDGSASGVRVDSDDVADVPSGARVTAVVGGLTAPDGAPGLVGAREVLSATVVAPQPGKRLTLAGVPDATSGDADLAATITPARHQVSVVMAVPAGGRRGSASLADVVASVDGGTNDFWSSQTDGAVTFAVTATHDYVDLSASCSDPRALWSQAASTVGFRGGADQHLLVYVGDQGDSCAAGLGTVGGGVDSGGVTYVSDQAVSVVAHELGHNMGLRHSGKLRCPGTTEDTGAGACDAAEYYDLYDVMAASWGPTGSLNPVQAHQLGALKAASAADVPSGGGRFTLSPVGGRTGLVTVRLADSGGQTYWVELREPVGQDAYLGSRDVNVLGLDTGVLVRSAPSGDGPGSLLLDASPSQPAGWTKDFTAAMVPGSAVTVAGGRWRITVDSITDGGSGQRARISVTPAVPGASTTPDGSLTGAQDADDTGSTPAPDPAPVPSADPSPAPPTTEPLLPSGSVSRREGSSRYGTAVAVSRASHPGTAPVVVVASGETFPDALAAGPLAASQGAPLLLAPRDGTVEPGVLDELRRLAPQKVLLAGGQGAVSDAVAAQLAAVAPLERVSGSDRFDTAARLAAATGQRGGTVYLAAGETFADAVSGGALAAHQRAVVLLTARDALPGATRSALAAIGPERVVLLGGTASVGTGPAGEVASLLPGADVVRRSGADRYATAAAVALAGYPDGAGTVYLASGDAFADALAGGPAAGTEGAPLLLTSRGCVPAATVTAVTTLRPRQVVVLGGSSAVPADALRPC